MKTNIVYSLTSDNTDLYLEQLMISVYSLRLYNPDAFVLLVCDEATQSSLGGHRDMIKPFFNSVIVVEVPKEFNKMRRSRYIKTNLRNFIQGDYLFIDTDTIICGSLVDIDSFAGEIGCCAEFNESFVITEWLKKDIELSDLSLIGWDNILGKNYANSGVMYVKDNEQTRAFYRKWNENWLNGSNKGLHKDQPALGLTNEQFGNIIMELSGVWNCQVLQRNRDKYLNQAKIIHYFGSIDSLLNVYGLENVLLKIKIHGDIPEDFKEKLSNPQECIFNRKEIVAGDKLEFLYSGIYEFSKDYPTAYKLIPSYCRMYRTLKTVCWKYTKGLLSNS